MKTDFTIYLENVVARTLKEGGTASHPFHCKFLPVRDLWSFPKYPSKTAILPPTVDLLDALKDFISRNEPFLRETDCWLGTWINPNTGEYYLDIATGMADLSEAQRAAKQAGENEGRKIVAIFNPQLHQTIFLDEKD